MLVTLDCYCAVGNDREYDFSADDLIRALDRAGVNRAVITPVDRYMVVDNCEGNKFILESAQRHPDRLIPSCSINPWFGKRGEQELRRAAAEGARLLVLHPFIQGYQANDDLAWPLIEIAAEERLPVYIHTGPPGNASPWQVIDLAEQYPTADFIVGHCGATDFWNDAALAALSCENVYVEPSLARPFKFAAHMQALGPAKGVMGSFAPINDLAVEWTEMRKLLPPGDWSDFYGPNLLRLLAKRGPL